MACSGNAVKVVLHMHTFEEQHLQGRENQEWDAVRGGMGQVKLGCFTGQSLCSLTSAITKAFHLLGMAPFH